MSRLPENLRVRTKNYASQIIQLYVNLPRGRSEVDILGRQLLRSGTSVAATAREAARARSVQEFVAKLNISLQEADESALWLELLKEDCGIGTAQIDPLLDETNQLIAIHDNVQAINQRKLKFPVSDFKLSVFSFQRFP
jgi:four helix bundle protein